MCRRASRTMSATSIASLSVTASRRVRIVRRSSPTRPPHRPPPWPGHEFSRAHQTRSWRSTRRETARRRQDLRSVGHDVQALVERAQLIQRRQSAYSMLPSDSVTDHIIKFLSEFAEGTRYYNIDFFVGGKSKAMGDPIKTWHAKVGAAILTLPEIRAKRQRWQAQAQQVAGLIWPAVVFATAADSTSLSTVAEMPISESEASEINKQAQWKILAIVRYFSLLIADLADAAHAASHRFIPDMREHCGFFCGDDAILHRYTTWPPRGIP
jgi:hypothetical protein